jgi:very-short-patch-repair endonuclease
VRPLPPGPVDVSIVGRRVRRDGIRTHDVATFHRADWRWMRGLAVSTPARALLEVACELSAEELAQAVERAQVRRLVTQRQLEAAIARAGRHRGVRPLRALIGEPFTRSKAERIVVALVRAARLPEPAFNATAEGFEVDVLWRRERVVLEFDSYEFHATRAAFERDRRRTAALTRGRYIVLRTTWRELTHESHALVARTSEALARNRGV